jgi:hypothetical protein
MSEELDKLKKLVHFNDTNQSGMIQPVFSVDLRNLRIVACRPAAGQRSRNKHLYDGRY